MKKRVVILFGGRSGEHEVSIVSATAIFKALDKSRYDVMLVGIDKTGKWLLPDETKLLAQSSNPKLVSLNQTKAQVSLLPFESERKLISLNQQGSGQQLGQIDVIIPVLHGPNGEDGTMQGFLELANIPYVGSGVLGSALCMDKDAAKRILRDAGVPVVPFMTAKRNDFKKHADAMIAEMEQKFGYPFFVKPANLGSSVGVEKVKSRVEAQEKIAKAFRYDTKVLIEKAVHARELECAVLGHHEPRASIVGEIVPHGEFYSYEAKYVDENGAELLIPAPELSSDVIQKIQNYSLKAFKALECAGLARVDFFLDRDSGEIYLNEVNTFPGFTPVSMYPKLWEATGVGYAELLAKLIALAEERFAEKSQNEIDGPTS
jgi:D-alanine-D-alanine ligase